MVCDGVWWCVVVCGGVWWCAKMWQLIYPMKFSFDEWSEMSNTSNPINPHPPHSPVGESASLDVKVARGTT